MHRHGTRERLFLQFNKEKSITNLTGDSADAVMSDRSPLVLRSHHGRLHSHVVADLY